MAASGYCLGMARLARVVVSGVPHHVTQRGNRRQEPVSCEDDKKSVFLAVLFDFCLKNI